MFLKDFNCHFICFTVPQYAHIAQDLHGENSLPLALRIQAQEIHNQILHYMKGS